MNVQSFDAYMAKIDKNQDSMISRAELEEAAVEVAKERGIIKSEEEVVASAPEPVAKPVVQLSPVE
jgi:hypothetical protein